MIRLFLALLCLLLLPGAAWAENPASPPVVTSRPASAPIVPSISRPTVTSRPASVPIVPSVSLPPAASSRPASVPVSRQGPGQAPRPRAALRGSLAVVNLGRPGARGWRTAERLRQAFSAWSGGWARQPGIADHLAGKPQPEVLPSNESGRDLGEVLEKLRQGGRPSTAPLWKLGRLLGVDYLLVVKVRTGGVSARLFSVHKQRWAPQAYEHTSHETAPLRAYVLDQVGRRASPGSTTKRGFWHKKWWVWVVGGALAAVTLGFALSNKDTAKGTLHITVSR